MGALPARGTIIFHLIDICALKIQTTHLCPSLVRSVDLHLNHDLHPPSPPKVFARYFSKKKIHCTHAELLTGANFCKK